MSENNGNVFGWETESEKQERRFAAAMLAIIAMFVVVFVAGNIVYEASVTPPAVPLPIVVEPHDFYAESRGPGWSRARANHLTAHPACEVCGRTGDAVVVHHVRPVHVWLAGELEPGNLLSICGPNGCGAHFWLAHGGRWNGWNPHVREDAVLMRQRWQESKRLAEEKE